jgi:hypothetical protein
MSFCQRESSARVGLFGKNRSARITACVRLTRGSLRFRNGSGWLFAALPWKAEGKLERGRNLWSFLRRGGIMAAIHPSTFSATKGG